MAFSKDELKQLNDVVYGAITKFYQKVIAPKMATKEDIENMATKDDIKNMATKDGLAAVEERLAKRIDNLAESLTNVRTNHERRIRRLEDEVGLESEAKLTF